MGLVTRQLSSCGWSLLLLFLLFLVRLRGCMSGCWALGWQERLVWDHRNNKQLSHLSHWGPRCSEKGLRALDYFIAPQKSPNRTLNGECCGCRGQICEIRVPGAGWLRLRNATRVGRVINENEPALVFISFFSQVLIVLFNERNAVRLQNLVLDVVFPLSHNKESKQRSWVRVTTYSYLT